MSHLVQMAGLTVQNFLSAATGVALAFEFIRCFERRDAEGIGSFWADITRVTLHPAARLHCLCAGSCGSRRAANARGFGRRDDAGRRAPDHRARPRREPGTDQDVRGPMAAASSTPTAPSVREPFGAYKPHPDDKHLRTWCGADLDLRQGGGQHASGMGDTRRHAGAVRRRRIDALLGGGRGQPDPPHGGCRRTQPGGQGNALRHRGQRPVRGDHHRGELRRGQRDARQSHASRRNDTAAKHAAWRGCRRRGRRGALRFPALCHSRDFRCRADGRPQPRIRRQEDRGARGPGFSGRSGQPRKRWESSA